MRTVRKGDPIKAIRKAVDNSLMGRLLGFGDAGPASAEDRIPQYDPNRSIYDVDPAGLPSTIDDALVNFTPVGDIEAIAMSVADLSDGNYVQAALLPLMMVLPPAIGKKLRSRVDDLRRVKMSNLPEVERQTEVVKIMGDLQNIQEEALKFRATKPEAYDQAIMEVAQTSESLYELPFMRASSDDVASDIFVSGRQRSLGYTGHTPDPRSAGIQYRSESPIGGAPINTTDKRGMDLVEGVPSEKAMVSALLHQGHGSAGGTGLIPSSQMQRMKYDTPLARTPIPGQKYDVIRDGDRIRITAGDIEEGDKILSLSQQSQGTYGGKNRIVSTSAQDVADNYAAFHHNVHAQDPTDAEMFDMATDKLFLEQPLGPNPTQMEVDGYIEGLMKGMGMDMPDPRRPSFKIINTKGMPVTRADMMKPSSGRGSLQYAGEDEFGVSARQVFDVLETGLEDQGVPFMLLSPNRRYKYENGGRVPFKILKR